MAFIEPMHRNINPILLMYLLYLVRHFNVFIFETSPWFLVFRAGGGVLPGCGTEAAWTSWHLCGVWILQVSSVLSTYWRLNKLQWTKCLQKDNQNGCLFANILFIAVCWMKIMVFLQISLISFCSWECDWRYIRVSTVIRTLQNGSVSALGRFNLSGTG